MSVQEDDTDPLLNDLTITYSEANFNPSYIALPAFGITEYIEYSVRAVEYSSINALYD